MFKIQRIKVTNTTGKTVNLICVLLLQVGESTRRVPHVKMEHLLHYL